MARKIYWGFTGPLETNFGDYAMFINNILACNAEDITAFYYDEHLLEKVTERYFSSQMYYGDKRVKAVHVRIKKELNNINLKPVPIDVLLAVDNYDELRKEIGKLDVLIVSGGGYMNQLWYRLWLLEKLVPVFAVIHIAKEFGIPIYFMGNSYGPFEESGEFFRYQLLGLGDGIGVRDRLFSYGYLKEINVEGSSVQFVPDDLLFLDKRLSLVQQRSEMDIGEYVVLEMYYPMREIQQYLEPIAVFVREMRNKYNRRVVFLPFDNGTGGEEQGKYLALHIPELIVYELKDKYLPLEDAQNIIGNATLVVCTRYHALVLAIQQKTPVVNIIKQICGDNRYYYNKNYGILEYCMEGIPIHILDYIQNDFFQTLEFVIKEYNMLLYRQNAVYKSYIFEKNRKKLMMKRKRYINEIKKKAIQKKTWRYVFLKKIKGLILCLREHGIRHTLKCYLGNRIFFKNKI